MSPDSKGKGTECKQHRYAPLIASFPRCHTITAVLSHPAFAAASTGHGRKHRVYSHTGAVEMYMVPRVEEEMKHKYTPGSLHAHGSLPASNQCSRVQAFKQHMSAMEKEHTDPKKLLRPLSSSWAWRRGRGQAHHQSPLLPHVPSLPRMTIASSSRPIH